MSDMSTYAGQAAHYAAVRARLCMPKKRVEVETRPTARMYLPPPFDFVSEHSWRNLLRFTSLKTGISETAIMGRERNLIVVHGRMMLIALMRRHTGMSLGVIGRFWGLDHSAALNAIRRYESGASLARFEAMRAKAEKRKATVAVRKRAPVIPTKWTADEIAEVISMRDDGMLLRDIAKYYGVTPNAVGVLIKRQRRKAAAAAHVQDSKNQDEKPAKIKPVDNVGNLLVHSISAVSQPQIA